VGFKAVEFEEAELGVMVGDGDWIKEVMLSSLGQYVSLGTLS
jgi:hypothetical protein